MTRLLSSLGFAAALALTPAAFAQTTAPLQSATINDIKISGVAAPTTSAPPPVATGGSTNLLKNFESGVPVMPVLGKPNAAPTKDCSSLGC